MRAAGAVRDESTVVQRQRPLTEILSGLRRTQITITSLAVEVAFAMTIHKSQGGTFSRVVLAVRAARQLTATAMYVAVSRVRSGAGLGIVVGGPTGRQVAECVRADDPEGPVRGERGMS